MGKLIKVIKISATMELVTGLHIGSNSDNVEIGGVDCPVVKRAIKDEHNQLQPYVPGSSIKGKMRCLLEQMRGNAEVGGDKEIDNLFGSADAKKPSPSKLVVRDAYLTEESVVRMNNCDTMDMPYTEVKFENTINRIKGTAEHPRQLERIPAGVDFGVEFVVKVWDTDNAEKLVELLKKGIQALENDYLGGSGSRGYGQVRFKDLKQEEVSY